MHINFEVEKLFHDLKQHLHSDQVIEDWVLNHVISPIMSELYDRLEFFETPEDLQQEFAFLVVYLIIN